MLLPRTPLTQTEILAEFDQWVTPTLGDIRDTQRFQDEANRLAGLLDQVVERSLQGEGDIAETFKAEVNDILTISDTAECRHKLNDAIAALYLVTAKSDNAIKCQFPIYFKNAGFQYPKIRLGKIENGAVPNVIQATDLVSRVVALKTIDFGRAALLLDTYIDFLLSDPRDKNQLAALVKAHAATANDIGDTYLIAPLVAFQVRGSVAASEGHEPEQIARNVLFEWGLIPNGYFNLTDVTAIQLNDWIAENVPASGRLKIGVTGDKTRAFDLILPYQIEFSGHRIFVQSQFYAGDSGSVSHKNVDQADNARIHALDIFSDAWFVEYVDGAGYCASLRKDLMHLIFNRNTRDFFQIRSIPIRLRRVMQESGLFSPLDIAVLVYDGMTNPDGLLNAISSQGVLYGAGTITRMIALGWLELSASSQLSVHSGRVETVAMYSLLDKYVFNGQKLTPEQLKSDDFVIFPGFGPNYGAVSLESSYPAQHHELISRGYIVSGKA
jgi:hypothetical protein